MGFYNNILILLIAFYMIHSVIGAIDGVANNETSKTPTPKPSPKKPVDPKTTTKSKKPDATAPGKLCKKPGHYCGKHLKSMGYKINADRDPSKTLYECDMDNRGVFYHTCHSGECSGNAGSAYCPCQPGWSYCGYELRMHNFMIDPDQNQNLYLCTGRVSVKKSETCSYKCQANWNGKSECIYAGQAYCESGKKYCGIQLASMGMSRWGPHVLFHCLDDAVLKLTWCANGCIFDEAEGSANCKEGIGTYKPSVLKDEL